MRRLLPRERHVYTKAAGAPPPWCVVQRWPWWYRDFSGFTFAVLIFVKDEKNLPILCHEIHHVRQFRREIFSFWIKYFWHLSRVGYRNNPYEIEARAVEYAVEKSLREKNRRALG